MNDFITVIDDALDAATCEAIIARFEASDRRAPGVTGQGVDKAHKDSTDLTITGQADWQDVHALLMDVSLFHLMNYVRQYPFLVGGAMSLTLRDPQTGEPFQLDYDTFGRMDENLLRAVFMRLYRSGMINLQKYSAGSGGYHRWHSEIYPRDERCEVLHRVLLYMFYLNDVAEGGETEFFYQQQKITPKRGRMVIAPAGFTHTHKGHVPRSGDKYIATSWVLFQRAEAIYGAKP
jgi:hypothetical protein